MKKIGYYIWVLFISLGIFAQTDKTVVRNVRQTKVEVRKTPVDPDKSSSSVALSTKKSDTTTKDGKKPATPELIVEEEEIPDSLLHPRWKIQKTAPLDNSDLSKGSTDLSMPLNIEQATEYRDTLGYYLIGSKLNSNYLNVPVFMTPEEYQQWSLKKSMATFWKQKNEEEVKTKGKEKFDFTDMHFDLGPAEKIFGPGGVRIKTQGTAEIKMGANIKKTDNPSLPISNRKQTTINFDEKINLSVNGKIGDKMNMNLNYNTDATFDFDTQNLKLKYEGKEDEIIKLLEGGNISFPSNNSLVQGASSLFGIRTDLQFGKLKLQAVVSQKKSNSQSVTAKGGTQVTSFEIDAANYEENKHFFLSHYFRDTYDGMMATLPNIASGINITRVEIWVTNKSSSTANSRNILAFTDLGESVHISGPWIPQGTMLPYNKANNEYETLIKYPEIRNVDQASTVIANIPGKTITGGIDYEKIENARLLSSSEYTLNSALGYVSLSSQLQTDQVLAVAYEYTYQGQTYQVGEFSTDINEVSNCLIVKSLKNVGTAPSHGNWDLMMKNVYYLSSNVEKEKFRFDIKYQSDTAGVYLTYIPDARVKNTTLLKLLNCDRLDNNNKAHSNGYFDYVAGYTVSNGRVFLPSAEPFGEFLYLALRDKGLSEAEANKYRYQELYDTTKTIAKQIAEKDKYVFMGQFKGSRENVISLGAYNVPRGSVVVTAGGVTLTENSDYTVDYSAGEVTIINQSIIDAGTSINVSLESNTDYGQQRKTMVGLNFEYDFSKDFQIGGTIQHLTEQSLTSKVTMGAEPLKNTIWGLNINWKKESQLITNLLDKIPFLHLTQPSQISFSGEFAQLIAGTASGTQDNASYLDDFENTKNCIDISTPTSWVLSSVPADGSILGYNDKSTLRSGYKRAQMAWYHIDPLFTRRSSSLTPSHIKNDLEQLSNHYVREVYVHELFPNRDLSNYTGSTSTLNIFNLAYYPTERGPYNFSTDIEMNGQLKNPQENWGGMMRRLETSDFETANIEYIEFWMLDPFIYTRNKADASQYGGDIYFDLGEMSEDILRDGKKFYESGMPVDGLATVLDSTQWGFIPKQATVTYAFATSNGARALQDVGYNGLNDSQELRWSSYQNYLNYVNSYCTDSVKNLVQKDPANDNYHYFRGSDFDADSVSIEKRYKKINNPQGNSPDSDNRTESYDTSYKAGPDVEDINQDYTLNEYEKYYEYMLSISPRDTIVGQNYIVDKRTASVTLRNNKTEQVTWYQYRIPLDDAARRNIGGISDFSSIRFMRVYLKNFSKPIILRFGTFDLVRGEWRTYQQNLSGTSNTGSIEACGVSIEENNDKLPVNYVLPPGISRVVDPSQPQLTENNEQALDLIARDLSHGEAKAVYKNVTLDLRNYKRLQMFVHANALAQNITNLEDGDFSMFIRLGSDYKSNYYEYDIPLKLTPAGKYSTYSSADCYKVWPEENMLDVALTKFTALKKQRNKEKSDPRSGVSYSQVYSKYDEDKPQNKISIMGNPTLGEVKTMVIGIRNNAANIKSGEVWVNELRLLETNNEGGWAAQGTLNLQLSDFGTLNLAGKIETEGFGGLEQGIASRSNDNYSRYDITANFDLGKFFPDKAKVTLPVYYSVTKEKTKPKYNPLDTDMRMDDALDGLEGHERDSVEGISIKKVTSRNFSVSNAKVGITTKRHPMPYDPGNFSFSYSHSHQQTTGETTVYEREDNWRGALNYSYTPVYKTFQPAKGIKNNSKWLTIIKDFGINYLPQNVSFNTEMKRSYYELQERDMENLNDKLPLTFSQQFLWNREFSLRWDMTKNLHMNFQSATNAEIEEPYTPVNKDLYPERYQAWKDSVWQSIKNLGTPLTYQQQFTASYQLPLNKIPIFEWLNADASYNASYNWNRGSEKEDGTSLGNTIANNRTININSNLSLEKLYNLVPFLEEANKKFKGGNTKAKPTAKKQQVKNGKDTTKQKDSKNEKNANNAVQTKVSKSFVKEIQLFPDSAIQVSHGRKSKRLTVTAKTKEGKPYNIKFKVLDDNKIQVKAKDTVNLKVTVVAKDPIEEKTWYKVSQGVARLLMMARTASFSYRNNYSMSLPGFKNNVGDAFGQNKVGSVLSPGLDFAFGLIDDSYIDKAQKNKWLMDSTATSPATTSLTEDLQFKLTLEPVTDLKIDFNASRTQTRQKSIQYMYVGKPTTQSGTFTMTTISIGSAFEGTGNANNGYKSATFEKFCNSLDGFQQRIVARYEGTKYPQSSILAGKIFDPVQYGTINKYSADVMIPAFLSSYCGGGNSLDIFPTLARLLPNWTLRYSGLSKLPWFSEHFKSVNINHSYKSIYAVGSYSSFSTYMENELGLGFVTNATTSNPIPGSMYNISTVSINEAFSPLLGLDVTLLNNMTLKAEYKTTRVLGLSMTSVQINETTSKDWVFGMGYKISDINLFGYGHSRKVKTPTKKTTGKDNKTNSNNSSSTNTRSSKGNANTMKHDLNIRFDLSLRNQATIIRDIATVTSSANAGNKALKIAMSADYTMSKLLTMSAYYDMQKNTPLLSASSYPTTTHDFGISMKFSLTR